MTKNVLLWSEKEGGFFLLHFLFPGQAYILLFSSILLTGKSRSRHATRGSYGSGYSGYRSLWSWDRRVPGFVEFYIKRFLFEYRMKYFRFSAFLQKRACFDDKTGSSHL
ncbi:MAG: hypothetical protein ACI383_02505, partial [Rummeliibacillus sp.]